MPTMVVLVDLKEGVDPADYERWVERSYAPAVGGLPSVSDWRNHRVTGLLGTDEKPPHQYVVTLQVGDMRALGRDMARPEMERLIPELHEYADVTQLLAERFA